MNTLFEAMTKCLEWQSLRLRNDVSKPKGSQKKKEIIQDKDIQKKVMTSSLVGSESAQGHMPVSSPTTWKRKIEEVKKWKHVCGSAFVETSPMAPTTETTSYAHTSSSKAHSGGYVRARLLKKQKSKVT